MNNIEKDSANHITGVQVEDRIGKENLTIRCKSVINACGIFSDAIRKMDDPEAKKLIVPASGMKKERFGMA